MVGQLQSLQGVMQMVHLGRDQRPRKKMLPFRVLLIKFRVSYVGGLVSAITQAAASAATTPRTGTSSRGSNTYSPKSDAVVAKNLQNERTIISNRKEFESIFSDKLKNLNSVQKDTAWKVYQESSNTNKTLVMGRLADTEVGESIGMQRLNTENWTLTANDAWVQGD